MFREMYEGCDMPRQNIGKSRAKVHFYPSRERKLENVFKYLQEKNGGRIKFAETKSKSRKSRGKKEELSTKNLWGERYGQTVP